MPFGLQIMLTCLPACIHNDNPLNVLDLDIAFNHGLIVLGIVLLCSLYPIITILRLKPVKAMKA